MEFGCFDSMNQIRITNSSKFHENFFNKNSFSFLDSFNQHELKK